MGHNLREVYSDHDLLGGLREVDGTELAERLTERLLK